MRFFRHQTLNQIVIMGRKTLDSIGGALPNRYNIVLSHNSVLFPSDESKHLVTSIDESLFLAEKISKRRRVYVVGGASTYAQFSPYVDEYFVTVVDKAVHDADAYFSEEIWGDQDSWDMSLVEGYEYDPAVDEAPFKIFRLVSKNADQISASRQKKVAAHEARIGRLASRRTSRDTVNARAASLSLHFG
jgi:dihydrofolate reductase